MPSVELHKQFRYEVKNPTNLDSSYLGLAEHTHKVNYAQLGAACDMSEAQVLYLLRQILTAVGTATRKEYQVKLNLRLGILKFRGGALLFESDADTETLSRSSCTT